MLLRTTYLLDFIREMSTQSKSSTLRELYYISEAWDLGKFHAQDESNKLIEDLEILFDKLKDNTVFKELLNKLNDKYSEKGL